MKHLTIWMLCVVSWPVFAHEGHPHFAGLDHHLADGLAVVAVVLVVLVLVGRSRRRTV